MYFLKLVFFVETLLLKHFENLYVRSVFWLFIIIVVIDEILRTAGTICDLAWGIVATADNYAESRCLFHVIRLEEDRNRKTWAIDWYSGSLKISVKLSTTIDNYIYIHKTRTGLSTEVVSSRISENNEIKMLFGKERLKFECDSVSSWIELVCARCLRIVRSRVVIRSELKILFQIVIYNLKSLCLLNNSRTSNIIFEVSIANSKCETVDWALINKACRHVVLSWRPIRSIRAVQGPARGDYSNDNE